MRLSKLLDRRRRRPRCSPGSALAQDAPGAGLVMYMQMGGNAGDGATLARQTGAAEAAKALGVELHEQFSAWAPETMINQFKEAMAANPNCIEIMGHPGSAAFHDLVAQAVGQGIVVTVGNSPMTDLQTEFGPKGLGYAGVDLYAGGKLTAEAMLAQGPEVRRRGDGLWRVQPGRARPVREGPRRHAGGGRPEGRPAGDHAGREQRRLARHAGARRLHPEPPEPEGDRHPARRHHRQMGQVMQQAGKQPGDIIVGGIDLGPATIDGLKSGYISATLDQLLYLQGFMPVVQCVMTAKYKMPGLSLNTGAGVVTPETIDSLVELIDEGIR